MHLFIVLICTFQLISTAPIKTTCFSEEKATYARIGWGDSYDWITYRIGSEPAGDILLPDGSRKITYKEVGESSFSPTGSDEGIVDDPGDTIIFYLDNPLYRDITTGVYRMDIYGNSELLYYAGLEQEAPLTLTTIVTALGTPQNKKLQPNGTATVYYSVEDYPHYRVYFTAAPDGQIIKYGITIDAAEGILTPAIAAQ